MPSLRRTTLEPLQTSFLRALFSLAHFLPELVCGTYKLYSFTTFTAGREQCSELRDKVLNPGIEFRSFVAPEIEITLSGRLAQPVSLPNPGLVGNRERVPIRMRATVQSNLLGPIGAAHSNESSAIAQA